MFPLDFTSLPDTIASLIALALELYSLCMSSSIVSTCDERTSTGAESRAHHLQGPDKNLNFG